MNAAAAPLTDQPLKAQAIAASAASHTAEFVVTATNRIDDVAGAWARLTATGVESPGQDLAFVRHWASAMNISERDQLYVGAEQGGNPIAILALYRKRRMGLRVLTWLPGPHVGCNAPIVDRAKLEELGPAGRRALWQAMLRAIDGADLLSLPAIPDILSATGPLFGELGALAAGDTLYRAEFESWEQCNATQRSKSRRKHDRQQGERLESLGSVTFEELRPGDDVASVLETMFRQRTARFTQMGVTDPFDRPGIRGMYASAFEPDAAVAARLHVLRLEGEVVAVRYNIVAGTRMFCLISSMSDDPRTHAGSPGKQCLLRVMQTIFDAGYRCFDMGAGFTDEKRHWCNTQIALNHHVVPLTLAGSATAGALRTRQALRRRIKNNPRLLAAAKRVRAVLHRGKATGERAPDDQA